MYKGISTIIATIVLLVITIGLAGTAYIFISGLIGKLYSKTINVLDVSCNPFSSNQANITIILSNDGTANITDPELTVMVDGAVKSDKFTFTPSPILPRSTAVATSSDTYEMNKVHTVLVYSPSNSVRTEVWC
jgi:FlaG/FlaF family flagellin (archaellin)